MHLTQCDKKKKKLAKSETHSLNPWANKSQHPQRGQRGTESSQSAFNYKLWHHDGHLVSNRRSSSEEGEGLCSLCLPPDLPYPDSCPEIPTGCPRPSCEPVARVLSDVRMTGGRRKKENKRMRRGITQKKMLPRKSSTSLMLIFLEALVSKNSIP